MVAGLWCFDRGGSWPVLGVLLWGCSVREAASCALPLIPLAWYLGGWKRAVALVAVVGGLNLLGATLAGGSPLFEALRDYLDYVPQGSQSGGLQPRSG